MVYRIFLTANDLQNTLKHSGQSVTENPQYEANVTWKFGQHNYLFPKMNLTPLISCYTQHNMFIGYGSTQYGIFTRT
jgi:hypothetical protein